MGKEKEQKTGDDAVVRRLREIVRSVSGAGDLAKTIGLDEDLFRAGVLDSVALIGTVVRIEEQFQTKISDFEPSSWTTLRSIARLLSARPEGAGGKC